jgi:ribosomal protein S8
VNSFINIADFSPHLFWDVDRSKLNFEKSKEQIVYQVVEYGLMADWKLLQQVYGKEELKKISINLRTLDKVTLSLLAHFFKIDKSEFRCYTSSQSAQNFWNS